jgi:hypothetical protein
MKKLGTAVVVLVLGSASGWALIAGKPFGNRAWPLGQVDERGADNA